MEEEITVRGRTYRVERTDNHDLPYILHGKRGARLGLLRSRKDPSRLFAVNRGVTIEPGWWFTDRNGKLEVL